MARTLIGLDLGTTLCKAVLVNERLSLLGAAEKEYPLITLSESRSEQDARQWWSVASEVIRGLFGGSGRRPEDVRALSISAQGISFVPVDCECRPLRNALTWLDARALSQRRQILEQFPEPELFRLTGKRAGLAYVLPKLLWLMQEEPGIYEQAYRILMALDFLVARMCGTFVTDHTMASGTMFYDIQQRSWCAPILRRFGIEEGKLPQLRQSGTEVGALLPRAARELGLSTMTLVVVGGQDQKVAALAAGSDLDRTTISLGTAMAITQKCTRPVIDPLMRIPCFSDLLPDRWVLEASGIATGALDWLKRTLFPTRSYDDLNAMVLAEEERANRVFMFPFFAGPDTMHQGEELTGFIHGLDLSVSAGQIVRSLFEGISYQVRENIELLETLSAPVKELRVFGGGSRSPAWCQILADVTARPVLTFPTSEMGGMGAAMLAGIGAGVLRDFEEAVGCLEIGDRYAPRPGPASRYDELFQQYLEIQARNLGSPESERGAP